MSAKDITPEWLKQKLQSLSVVEPPAGLKDRLLSALPNPARREASPGPARWRLGAPGWVAIAASIAVFCGVAWLHVPARPQGRPLADANGSLSQVLAADYNAVRPADINTLDSNSL